MATNRIETKFDGENVFILAASDVDMDETLKFRHSFTRSALDAEFFLKDATLIL